MLRLRSRYTPRVFAALLACSATAPLNGEVVDITLGLPPVALETSTTTVAIALGRKLFFDERLSASGTVSCATCHDPTKGMADGLRVSVGDGGLKGSRNAPTLINARFNESQFWDGRRATLEEQALDPLFNPVEHGLRDGADLLARVRQDAEYVQLFTLAYDVSTAQLEPAHVARALAAFQQTLIAGDTPFDRYYYRGDKSALSPAAARGLAIFQGAGQCASCHTIGEKHALFTDHKFHRLSVGMRRIESKLAGLTREAVERRGKGESLDRLIMENADIAELGRFVVTLNPQDIGKFRTPSLRNVALTAPYMHDGSVRTLEEAVELEIYYRRAAPGYPVSLTLEDQADLVAFMRALTSPHLQRFAR